MDFNHTQPAFSVPEVCSSYVPNDFQVSGTWVNNTCGKLLPNLEELNFYMYYSLIIHDSK